MATKKTNTVEHDDMDESVKADKGMIGPITHLEIPKRIRQVVEINIRGTAPYAPRRPNELVMRDIEIGKLKSDGKITEAQAKRQRLKLWPEMEKTYSQNLHMIHGDPTLMLEDQPDVILGIPATAFKTSMVRATQSVFPQVPMSRMRLMFNIQSDPEDFSGNELVRIDPGYQAYRRITLTKNGGRWYHTEIDNWTATLRLVYPPTLVDGNQLIALLQYAGEFIGIGAGRPGGLNSSGTKGTFEIVTSPVYKGEPEHRTPEKRAADAAGRAARQAAGI